MQHSKNTQAAIREKDIGNKFYINRDYEQAIKHYTYAIEELDDSIAALYSNRAACYLRLNKYEEAIKDCTRAIELEPNYVKAIMRRANAAFHLGRWKQSAEDFQRIQKIDCDKTTKLQAKFYARFISERINEDENVLMQPRNRASIERKIGHVFLQDKKFTLALEHFNRGIKIDDKWVDLLCDRSECLLKSNKLDRALEDANAALELDPKFARAYNCRGRIYFAKKEYQLSLNDFIRSNKLEPSQDTKLRIKQVKAEIQKTIIMPSKADVEKLRNHDEIMDQLKDEQVRRIFSEIRDNPNLVTKYMQNSNIKKLILQIMDVVDPSFIQKLQQELQMKEWVD